MLAADAIALKKADPCHGPLGRFRTTTLSSKRIQQLDRVAADFRLFQSSCEKSGHMVPLNFKRMKAHMAPGKPTEPLSEARWRQGAMTRSPLESTSRATSKRLLPVVASRMQARRRFSESISWWPGHCKDASAER